MPDHVVSTKRRLQIAATGLMPLVALCAILGMASAYGFNLITFFTKVERHDASNFIVVTKVLGMTVNSRPATKADLVEDDAKTVLMKSAVLCFSGLVLLLALSMCFAALVGRPLKVLVWFDQKLGSVQWSHNR